MDPTVYDPSTLADYTSGMDGSVASDPTPDLTISDQNLLDAIGSGGDIQAQPQQTQYSFNGGGNGVDPATAGFWNAGAKLFTNVADLTLPGILNPGAPAPAVARPSIFSGFSSGGGLGGTTLLVLLAGAAAFFLLRK